MFMTTKRYPDIEHEVAEIYLWCGAEMVRTVCGRQVCASECVVTPERSKGAGLPGLWAPRVCEECREAEE